MIKTLLRRIVGRIKEMRYGAGLALSLMLIPLGYYLLIEAPQPMGQISGSFSILGGLALFWVIWLKGGQVERAERKKSDEKFEALIAEIRGIRQDINNIRQDRDERGRKDKQ